MRTIDSAVINMLANKTGIKPVNFVDIQWYPGGPFNRYTSSDAADAAGGISALVSIDNIDTGVAITGSSFGVSCAVTLADPDGELKAILDTNDIHKMPCRVMQWFTDLSINTAFEVFRGQISSPVVWSEGKRTLSFTILDQIHSRDVGFSLEQGQYNYVSDDIVGESWPVCFGDVLHVPAVLAVDAPQAVTTTMFGHPDASLPLKQVQMENDLANYQSAYWYFTGMIQNLQQMIVPFYITKQGIRFNGDISVAKSSFTLGYKGTELPKIAGASIDEINQVVQAFVPEWKASTAAAGIGYDLTFTPDTGKYPKFGDALSGLKPTSFTLIATNITSLSGHASYTSLGDITVKVLRVSVDDSEVDYTSYETMIYTRAAEVQEEYARAIVLEDNIKQTIEDLNADLDKINKLYDAEMRNFDETQDSDIGSKVDALGKIRNHFIANLQIQSSALTQANYDKQRCEVDAHNLKYVFESIKSIKKKIVGIFDAYVRLLKRYSTLVRIIDKQNELLIPYGDVDNSEEFVQDEDIDLKIKGVRIRGRFSGNRFTGRDIIPTDENVGIGQRESGDLDYFWVDNDETNLVDKYCQIQNGLIIRVTEQVGRRCRFDLIQRKSNIRSSPDDFTFVGMDEGMIKDAFSSATDGSETSAELHQLAQSIPSDINQGIKNILSGGARKQTIRIFQPGQTVSNPPTSGGYHLKYNGRVTDLIQFDARKLNILAALRDSTDLDYNDITVQCFTYDAALAAKDIVEAKKTKVVDDVGFDDGSKVVEFEITFTTGDLVKMYPLEVIDPTDADLLMVFDQDRVFVDVSIESNNGAHEHTAREIISRIESAVNSSAYSKELGRIKDKIRDANDAIIAETSKYDDAKGSGAANIKAQRDIISEQYDRYVATMALVQIPPTVLSEAYKLTSDSEFKVLFGLELLHFLAWRHSFDPVGMDIPDPHSEYYIVGTDITHIKAASPLVVESWLLPYRSGNRVDIMENMLMLPPMEAFIVDPGTVMYLWGEFQDVYVANIMPSTVRAIHAYRSVDGLRQLSPIPTSYYNKDQNDDYGRFTVTSITLRKPLSEYKDIDWEDGIYVSLTSSVGPNPMDVITWVLQQFSNLTLSGASYSSLHSKLANYPTNFALLSPVDALTLCKDIAYQSRCALWLKRDVVTMVYLPELAASTYTFTESNVRFGTIECAYSDSDFVTTKYTATWMYDYAKSEKYKTILRYNVSRFNEQSEEVNYYALTDRGLVEKTATFWLIRKSNMWKLAKFSAPLDAINVEPFDTVTLNFAGNYFSNGATYGVVQSANYNPTSRSMTLEVWLPIRAGEMTPYVFAWPAALSAATTYPLAADIQAGRAGDPFGDNTPTGIDYDPFSVNPTNIRPKDYGDITPTDLTDSIPLSSVSVMAETTALPVKPDNVDPEIADDKDEANQALEVGAAPPPPLGKDKDPARKAPDGGERVRVVSIKRKNLERTKTVTGRDITDPTGAAIDPKVQAMSTEISWYDIVDDAGTVYPVEFAQLNPNDTIPPNTKVTISWSPMQGRWVGLIPVLLTAAIQATSATADADESMEDLAAPFGAIVFSWNGDSWSTLKTSVLPGRTAPAAPSRQGTYIGELVYIPAV